MIIVKAEFILNISPTTIDFFEKENVGTLKLYMFPPSFLVIKTRKRGELMEDPVLLT